MSKLSKFKDAHCTWCKQQSLKNAKAYIEVLEKRVLDGDSLSTRFGVLVEEEVNRVRKAKREVSTLIAVAQELQDTLVNQIKGKDILAYCEVEAAREVPVEDAVGRTVALISEYHNKCRYKGEEWSPHVVGRVIAKEFGIVD